MINENGFISKYSRLFSITLLLLVFSSGTLAADSDLELSGFADNFFAWRLGLDNSKGAELLSVKTRLHPELALYAGDAFFTASFDVEYNSLDMSRFKLNLKEVYAEYAGSFYDFRLGRQIISWGRADGLQVTDIVCPRDKTAITGRAYEDSQLPIEGLSFRLFGQFYTLETILVPFFTPSALPIDPGNPLVKVLIPSEIDLGFGPMPFEYTISEAAISRELKDGEAAVRASFFFSAADFSLYFFRGWEDEPSWLVSVTSQPMDPLTLSIKPEYGKIWMGGVDAAFPLGALVLRIESAWISGRRFKPVDLSSAWIEKDQIKAMAGLDWNPGSGWMITAQYLEDVLIDYDDAIDRKEREPLATLSLSKPFLRDTLKLSAAGIMGMNNFDSAISISADYAVTDDFHISAGGDIFLPGPENDGYFGMLEELSSVNVRGKFTF